MFDSMFSRQKELSKQRLSICELCEFYNKETSKCVKCGCFMKAKTLFPSAKCPIGKWNKDG